MENSTLNTLEYYAPSINRFSLSNISNHEYRDLINMGFKLEIINRILSSTKESNIGIEQMVTLLTSENGVWQHNYVEDNGKCFICQEYTNHIDFVTEERISLRNSLNEKVENLIKKKSEELFRKKSSSFNNIILEINQKETQATPGPILSLFRNHSLTPWARS